MMIMSTKKRNEEIRRLAKKESLLAKDPFDRVVREVMDEYYFTRHIKRSSSKARDAMRAAADNYLHKLFLCAGWVAEHRGRTTVVPDDLKFVRAIWEGEIAFFAEEEEI
jgi:histone H3/H4